VSEKTASSTTSRLNAIVGTTGDVANKHDLDSLIRSFPPAVRRGRHLLPAELEFPRADEAEFAAAVAENLEGGILRYSKRLELLQLAKVLRIDRYRAAVIIAKVQHRIEEPAPLTAATLSRNGATTTQAHSGRRSEWFLKIAALFLTAALVDLVIVRAFFG